MESLTEHFWEECKSLREKAQHDDDDDTIMNNFSRVFIALSFRQNYSLVTLLVQMEILFYSLRAPTHTLYCLNTYTSYWNVSVLTNKLTIHLIRLLYFTDSPINSLHSTLFSYTDLISSCTLVWTGMCPGDSIMVTLSPYGFIFLIVMYDVMY